jgi:hypothetical protein
MSNRRTAADHYDHTQQRRDTARAREDRSNRVHADSQRAAQRARQIFGNEPNDSEGMHPALPF